VLCLSENGSGEGHPVVVRSEEFAHGAPAVNGVKTDSAGASPHTSGLARGAWAPPFIVRTRALNGS